MGLSIHQCVAGHSLSNIKTTLVSIYINYVSGACGLEARVLRDAFASFLPPVSLPHDGIVSALPSLPLPSH